MKAFASWSGGKDAMLAVYRFTDNSDHTVEVLVNMCDKDGDKSRSHGLKTQMIQQQAKSLGIKLIQKATQVNEYRQNLVGIINDLKKEGIEAGVFGDIFLQEHRDWIEAVCQETGIQAIFPLWKENTNDLLQEFYQLGYQSLVIAIDETKLDKNWLGRMIDHDFLADINKLPNIDPCAEFGEYHSFVFDGPGFSKKIDFNTGKIYTDGKTTFLEIN